VTTIAPNPRFLSTIIKRTKKTTQKEDEDVEDLGQFKSPQMLNFLINSRSPLIENKVTQFFNKN
jgi:hypothetical protein